MSDATDQLARLDDAHSAAVEGRRRVDADERSAYDAVRACEAELEELLRQRLSGDEPPAKVLADAQRKLDRAREGTRREWALERQAGDRVVRDAYAARMGFAEQNVDALLAAEYAQAAPLVAEMDQLAGRVTELHALLGASERRVVSLIHVTRPGDERLVTAPRSDAFARAAQDLLEAGGEAAPRYRAERSLVPSEAVAS